MKRISIIQDAEESNDKAEQSSDHDIILNCIEGDCSDDEDLPVIQHLFRNSKSDSDIVDQDIYSDYNYIEPFVRHELDVSLPPPAPCDIVNRDKAKIPPSIYE